MRRILLSSLMVLSASVLAATANAKDLRVSEKEMPTFWRI